MVEAKLGLWLLFFLLPVLRSSSPPQWPSQLHKNTTTTIIISAGIPPRFSTLSKLGSPGFFLLRPLSLKKKLVYAAWSGAEKDDDNRWYASICVTKCRIREPIDLGRGKRGAGVLIDDDGGESKNAIPFQDTQFFFFVSALSVEVFFSPFSFCYLLILSI